MEKIFQFNKCLTNGMDYFIGSDPFHLLDFRIRNQLPDDLLTEFTTNESGDNVVLEGVMIPLSRCEVVPHTIYINFEEKQRILNNTVNELEFVEGYYPLKITNGTFCVFPISYLENFTLQTVENLIAFQKKYSYAFVDLENGWYEVQILAGLSQQNYEKSAYRSGQILDDMEPTFEFCLKKMKDKPLITANIGREFKIEINKEIYKDRRFI